MRLRSLLAVLALFPSIALAQYQGCRQIFPGVDPNVACIQLSGSKLLDNNGKPLAAGKIVLTVTNASGTPATYTPQGGPSSTQPFVGQVVNGAVQNISGFPFTVVNTLNASPPGLVMHYQLESTDGSIVYLDVPKWNIASTTGGYSLDSLNVLAGWSITGLGYPRTRCSPTAEYTPSDNPVGAKPWICSILWRSDKSVQWTQNPSSDPNCPNGQAIVSPTSGPTYCVLPENAYALPGEGFVNPRSNPPGPLAIEPVDVLLPEGIPCTVGGTASTCTGLTSPFTGWTGCSGSTPVLGFDGQCRSAGTPGPLVNSFNGRSGVVVPTSGDYTAAMVGAAPAGTYVNTFNGRSGVVVPTSGDYTAAMVGALPVGTLLVNTFNGRSGVVVPTTGDYTAAMVGAIPVGTSLVNSFKGRTGVVVPASGDYTAAMVTNAADVTAGNTFIPAQTFSNGLNTNAINTIGTSGSFAFNVTGGTALTQFAYSSSPAPGAGSEGIEIFPPSGFNYADYGVNTGTPGGDTGFLRFEHRAANVLNSANSSEWQLQTTGFVSRLAVGNAAATFASVHIMSTQSLVPTVVIGAGAGGGAAAVSVAAGSTDVRGQVNLTTGTTPAAAPAVLFTVTFRTAYTTAPIVILQDYGGGFISTNPGYAVSVTTTGFTVLTRIPLTASNPAYAISYHIIG